MPPRREWRRGASARAAHGARAVAPEQGRRTVKRCSSGRHGKSARRRRQARCAPGGSRRPERRWRETVAGPERTAEMRRAGEAALPCDFLHRHGTLRARLQEPCGMFEPCLPDIAHQRSAMRLEQPVQMLDRDVHRCGDRRGVEVVIAQMHPDVALRGAHQRLRCGAPPFPS